MAKDNALMQGILKALGKQDVASLQTEFDTYKTQAETQAAQLQEQLDASVAANQALASQVAELQEQLKAINDVAAAEAAAQAQAAELAAQAKKEKRMTALSAAVGDVQAKEVFDAFAGFDDKKFDAVVKAMAQSYDAEAAAEAASVQGAEVEVVNAPAANDRLLKQIQEKYQSVS